MRHPASVCAAEQNPNVLCRETAALAQAPGSPPENTFTCLSPAQPRQAAPLRGLLGERPESSGSDFGCGAMGRSLGWTLFAGCCAFQGCRDSRQRVKVASQLLLLNSSNFSVLLPLQTDSLIMALLRIFQDLSLQILPSVLTTTVLLLLLSDNIQKK